MRFRANPRAGALLTQQPEMRRMLRSKAREIRAKAEELAPRGHSKRGVAKSYRVADGPGGDVIVETTDPFGHLVEFGSINNPPYAPLRRAVRAVDGLELREED